jgi:hypothetical protein
MLDDRIMPLIIIVSILATVLTANYIIKLMMRPMRSSSVCPHIELDELPDFVDPELVHERLNIPPTPNIDFPPAVHSKPRWTTPTWLKTGQL